MTRLILEQEGALARLTMEGPARNALTLDLQRDLRAALADLTAAGETRLLILRGAGGAFCSGASLGDLQGAGTESLGTTVSRQMEEISNRVIEDLQSVPFTTLSVVEGAAAGAGASLALATDLTLAAESAFFLFPFAPNLGLMPDLGATHVLSERLGQARAMGVSLLGGRISGRQAADWGLIWQALPDAELENGLEAVARSLLAAPAGMAPALRRLFAAARGNDLCAQMALEAEVQRHHLDSAAFEEGRRAFLEKRPARFHGPA